MNKTISIILVFLFILTPVCGLESAESTSGTAEPVAEDVDETDSEQPVDPFDYDDDFTESAEDVETADIDISQYTVDQSEPIIEPTEASQEATDESTIIESEEPDGGQVASDTEESTESEESDESSEETEGGIEEVIVPSEDSQIEPQPYIEVRELDMALANLVDSGTSEDVLKEIKRLNEEIESRPSVATAEQQAQVAYLSEVYRAKAIGEDISTSQKSYTEAYKSVSEWKMPAQAENIVPGQNARIAIEGKDGKPVLVQGQVYGEFESDDDLVDVLLSNNNVMQMSAREFKERVLEGAKVEYDTKVTEAQDAVTKLEKDYQEERKKESPNHDKLRELQSKLATAKGKLAGRKSQQSKAEADLKEVQVKSITENWRDYKKRTLGLYDTNFGGDVVAVIGFFTNAYNQYSGLGKLFALGLNKKSMQERAQQYDKIMCQELGLSGTHCWVDMICNKYPDRIPSKTNSIVASAMGGTYQFGAHIEAEKSKFIGLYNESFDITDRKGYFYKVTYKVSNTNDHKMNFNIRFFGDKEIDYYEYDEELEPGAGVNRMGIGGIYEQSNNDYDKVCIVMSPGVVDYNGKEYKELCTEIVLSTARPTKWEEEAIQTKKATGTAGESEPERKKAVNYGML